MARRSLKPQLNQIRAWVQQGRTDAWIAHQLEISAGELREFRKQYDLSPDEDGPGSNEIDLRDEIEAEIEAATEAEEAEKAERAEEDESETDGYGIWLDAAVKDNPVYTEHSAGKRDVTVRIEADQIVIRRAGEPQGSSDNGDGESDDSDE